MKKEIRADYSKVYLLPPSLEDWVGQDHPARFIRDFVDYLDLASFGFKVHDREKGRPPYSTDLLLKVWLYGYFEKIRSSRELERGCRERISLIWLTGENSPDHNTLWRFWAGNKVSLRGVFRSAVQVAQRANLVGLVLHAVDGTKVLSAGSKYSAWHGEDLRELLKRVDESIDKMMSEVEDRESLEKGEYRLPEGLREAEERRRVIGEALEGLELRGQKRYHRHDPEARMMRSDGAVKWAYNAQVVVDSESGMIVAEEVTSEETDNHQLLPMLERVKENLGKVALENVADSGYRSLDQLTRAQERGYEVLVNPHPRDKEEAEGAFHLSKFEYNQERDCYLCPRGKELYYQYTIKRKSSRRLYQCRSFRNCPVRWECSKSGRGRRISVSPDQAVIFAQRAKQRRPDKQALLRRRQGIVEPIFGWIKAGMWFRRWTVRGLENVRTQWAMICLSINLKKLFRYWKEGQIVFS